MPQPGPGPSDAGNTGSSSGGPATVTCSGASLAAGDHQQMLTLDGGARTFQIHVPPGLDPSKPAPLVFAFHGGGENAWQFEGFTHIHTKSDSSGFVLVEADGVQALGPSAVPPPSPDAGVVLEVWNAGNCCEYAAQLNGNVDDVGFVRAMIDTIEKQTCIDPKRIFATGFSNGGMLSHRLACQLSDRIAAIVSVSGGSGATDYDKTPPQTLFECNPGRPVPVLHIHGTQDACYPFDGGWGPLSLVTFEAVKVTVQNWVTRNGCSAGSPTTVFHNGVASCQLYPCPKAGEVELCTITGGGHYWPGGDDWPGSTVFCGSGQGIRSADLVANDQFWTWFADHPMP
jgi:polyhydroxybutyrate depolymerase